MTRPAGGRSSEKFSEELRYRQAEQKCFRVLCNYLHLLERWEKGIRPADAG